MTDQPRPIPFVPISRNLIDGSLWESDLRVRVLWVTMLMIASEPSRRGAVDMTVRALAARAAMSPEDVRFALDVLLSPDPLSRTPDLDGRRIRPISSTRSWGWEIVNWTEYETARERMLNAARQARYKARHAGGKVTPGNGEVTPTHLEVEDEVEVEVEVEGEKKRAAGAATRRRRSSPKKFTPPGLDEVRAYLSEIGATFTAEHFVDHHEGNGWTWGKAHHPVKSWRAVAREWKRRDAEKPRNGTALVGSHPNPRKPPDISTAPPDLQDIARRIALREDTTEAEDDRYADWLNGGTS